MTKIITANQLWKKSNSDLPFKLWIDQNKLIELKDVPPLLSKENDHTLLGRSFIDGKYHFKKGTHCYYCDLKFIKNLHKSIKMKTIDHIIPKSKGGTNRIENKVSCCYLCNSLKNNLTLENFIIAVKYSKLNSFTKKKIYARIELIRIKISL